MNQELRNFISIYLDLQQAYDTSGYLRPTLYAFKPSYVEAVKNGLAELVRDRNVSVGDYERITAIEFNSEEELHSYLAEIYEYLFGSGDTRQPVPPPQ
ncbi:hypothetical protein [Streptomyces sp. NPDC101150]|uniref:hypothetical protein n=1 Tax=Streptomyces sp. NPDC101150 TaxID=3366114 RepID=UPI003814D6D8